MGNTAKIQQHIVNEITELICDPTSVQEDQVLFEVKVFEKEIYGPIQAQDLKDFFQIHEDMGHKSLVKRTDEQEFLPYYEHPYFQRRRPQVVSKQEFPKTQEKVFWVLKDGQKQGPYKREDIIELVESAQVLRTDLISLDEGHKWQKIYHLEEFDRRQLNSTQLPSPPQGEVFVNSLKEARTQLASSDELKQEAEALSGLAYIGSLRPQQQSPAPKKSKAKSGTDTITFEASDLARTPSWVWYGMLAVSLIGIISVLISLNNDDNDMAQTPSTRTIEQRQATQEQGTSKVQRSPAIEKNQGSTSDSLEAQRNAPERSEAAQRAQNNEREFIQGETPARAPSRAQRQTTSFRESRSFQQAQRENEARVGEREMEDDPYIDDYYYDDGDRPIEQDPVRSRVSRETLEPADTWADDLAPEDERYPEDAFYEDYGSEEPANEEIYEDY